MQERRGIARIQGDHLRAWAFRCKSAFKELRMHETALSFRNLLASPIGAMLNVSATIARNSCAVLLDGMCGSQQPHFCGDLVHP